MAAAVLGAVGLLAAACGSGGDAGDDRQRTVLVFAAASLTDVMADAEARFEAANPTIDVQVNLAGSAALRAQILEGAPADIITTANQAVMDDLVDAGQVADTPAVLARNRLVLAVAPGNPADVDELADLADPELFVGLCATEVPCGDLADRAAAAAGVPIEADTREPDVRALLAKIEAGELDAGLVYHTDVTASASDVTAIELPTGLPTTTDYPIAPLVDAANPQAAQAFLAFLSGPDGRDILSDNGFQVP